MSTVLFTPWLANLRPSQSEMHKNLGVFIFGNPFMVPAYQPFGLFFPGELRYPFKRDFYLSLSVVYYVLLLCLLFDLPKIIFTTICWVSLTDQGQTFSKSDFLLFKLP